MIAPDQVMTNASSIAKGLYESFYFRGTNIDKSSAFWLKHNLLVYKKQPQVKIESTLLLFESGSGQPRVAKQEEMILLADFLELKSRWGDGWTNFQFQFANGGHLLISPGKLRGQMVSDAGEARWGLDLHSQGEIYYHFSQDWFYRAGFPKKKILTNDTRIVMKGDLQIGDRILEGPFIGMNGHNWGTEHAYKYVYADCNQFVDAEAYFDGFSAKIALAGGLIKSPFFPAPH